VRTSCTFVSTLAKASSCPRRDTCGQTSTRYTTLAGFYAVSTYRQAFVGVSSSHSANQLPLALIEGLPASGNHKMVRFPHVQRPVAVIVELVENLLCNVTRPVSRL
jgi:hypothetical protein